MVMMMTMMMMMSKPLKTPYWANKFLPYATEAEKKDVSTRKQVGMCFLFLCVCVCMYVFMRYTLVYAYGT